MKTVIITLGLLACLSHPTQAQVLGETGRKVADAASWGTLGTSVLLQTLDALHCPQKTACLLHEGVQIASVLGSVWYVKENVDSPRPCATFSTDPCTGADAHKNIPSGHTALAVQAAADEDASHPLLKWGLAGTTALLRGVAGKHDWKGIASGAGMGFGWTLVW
jgi:hypothetical protein